MRKIRNKTEYRVAIASKGRAGKVTTIDALGLPAGMFDLFVDGPAEKLLYEEQYPQCHVIDTHTSGISAARNAMLDYYGEGTNVVMACDDVQSILENVQGGEMVTVRGEELHSFITHAFKITKNNGTKLWGVYPVNNHFYMNRVISTGFCIGSFCGVTVGDIRFPAGLALKEDYAFTIEHVKRYRKVARFNYYTVKAKHYKNAGGCQDYRNDDLERQACEFLIGHYPWCVRKHPRRKNEVVLSFTKKRGN
jgi:hypothetical protein